MLHTLSMHLREKLGLAAIFSIAFVTIAFDIVRTLETLTVDAINAVTPLWTNLESAVAVCMSALPSYAALMKGRAGPPAYRERELAVSEGVKVWMSDESDGGIGASSLKEKGQGRVDVRVRGAESPV